MPRVSKLSLARSAAFTQVELAGKIGLLQTLVTDYETGRLPLTAEMAVSFAMALDVTLEELLHPNAAKSPTRKPTWKALRRLEKIEAPPREQQATLLRMIDTARRA